MPWTNIGAHAILNMLRLTAPTLPAGFYAALFTALPDNTGSGGTEASYSGYARVRVDNKLAAAASKQTVNSGGGNDVTFAQVPTTVGASILGFGIYTASSGGDLWRWDMFASTQRAFTCLASSDVLSCPGMDFTADAPVRILKMDDSPTPTGLLEGTTYYVRDVSGTTFKLAATIGGAAINVSADGSGQICRIIDQPLNAGVTPQFTAGSMIFAEF